MKKTIIISIIILFLSCKSEVISIKLAVISTNAINSISDTTALTGGTITNDGGGSITKRGVCYDTIPMPTIDKNTIISGSGIGSFTSILTDLKVNKLYYLRAYAINSAGTSYGNELKYRRITTQPGAGVTFNGYTYRSIVLGNGQEWMTENLRTSSFSNGNPISEAKTDNEWKSVAMNDKLKYCYYNNDPSNEVKYGKLYNWNVINETRNVCPNGWHVSTDEDWKLLTDYLIEEVAGGKMKSIGTEHWESPNTDATNESGFSALPGGFRSSTGGFSKIGSIGRWWSYDKSQLNVASSRMLRNTDVNVTSQQTPKEFGLSILCVRD
jgi:uncharacterized protein (TIGR02145 family)